jgi:hypothetical protein
MELLCFLIGEKQIWETSGPNRSDTTVLLFMADSSRTHKFARYRLTRMCVTVVASGFVRP